MVDNLDIIICPACQKEMVQVFVEELNANVDICVNGCGGIYFDNREYQHCDDKHECVDEIIEALKNKSFEKVDDNLVRNCPVCGTQMVKNYSSTKKQIQIDECYECGGKFLDKGELEKIRMEYHSEEDKNADTVQYIHSIIGKDLEKFTDNKNYKTKTSCLRTIFNMIFGIN